MKCRNVFCPLKHIILWNWNYIVTQNCHCHILKWNLNEKTEKKLIKELKNHNLSLTFNESKFSIEQAFMAIVISDESNRLEQECDIPNAFNIPLSCCNKELFLLVHKSNFCFDFVRSVWRMCYDSFVRIFFANRQRSREEVSWLLSAQQDTFPPTLRSSDLCHLTFKKINPSGHGSSARCLAIKCYTKWYDFHLSLCPFNWFVDNILISHMSQSQINISKPWSQ